MQTVHELARAVAERLVRWGRRTCDLLASHSGGNAKHFPDFSPWGCGLQKKRYPIGYLFFVSARRGSNMSIHGKHL